MICLFNFTLSVCVRFKVRSLDQIVLNIFLSFGWFGIVWKYFLKRTFHICYVFVFIYSLSVYNFIEMHCETKEAQNIHSIICYSFEVWCFGSDSYDFYEYKNQESMTALMTKYSNDTSIFFVFHAVFFNIIFIFFFNVSCVKESHLR